jgi:hypothetical protein
VIAGNNNKLEAYDNTVGLRLAGSTAVDGSTIKALGAFDEYLTQKNEKHNHQQRTSWRRTFALSHASAGCLLKALEST